MTGRVEEAVRGRVEDARKRGEGRREGCERKMV